VSHNLAHPWFQVAFSKQFPFLFPLTCLFSLSVSENQPVIKERSSNLRFIHTPDLHQFLDLKLSLVIFKKWKGQSFGHSPAEVQMARHMEAIFQAPVCCRPKLAVLWVQNLWRPASQHLHLSNVWVWTVVLITCLFSQSIHNNISWPHPTVLRNRSRGRCVKLIGPSTELEGMPRRRGVGGGIEAASKRLMVHVNWGWSVWSVGSGCGSQVCRGPGRQMWGPPSPSRAKGEQWGGWEMICLSSVCVCVLMDVWRWLTTCFSFPLKSHLLCLDYYFGRRHSMNICPQFALPPHSHCTCVFVLKQQYFLLLFCVIPAPYHIIFRGL